MRACHTILLYNSMHITVLPLYVLSVCVQAWRLTRVQPCSTVPPCRFFQHMFFPRRVAKLDAAPEYLTFSLCAEEIAVASVAASHQRTVPSTVEVGQKMLPRRYILQSPGHDLAVQTWNPILGPENGPQNEDTRHNPK